MRWVKLVSLWLVLLLAVAVLLLAIFYPEAVRLLLGLARLYLWSSGLMISGLLVLAGSLVVFRSRKPSHRYPAALLIVLSLSSGLGFWLRAPDYQIADVSYPSGDAVLAGDLYLPEASSRVPAMVLVHGSAQFPRAFYDIWADFLADNGFAVLLVDKRGVADSGGKFVSNNNGSLKNLSRLADDVVAGVEYLSSRPEIDPERIGIYGISQAGWVGVLAAARSDSIRFMVMVTAPTVSVGEEGVWSDLRGDDVDSAIATMAEAEANIQSTSPSGYDPRQDLAELEIPGLWLFGADDNSIPSVKSAQVLDQLIRSGKPFTHRTYSDAGHILIGGPDSKQPLRMSEQSWADTLKWLMELNNYLPD